MAKFLRAYQGDTRDTRDQRDEAIRILQKRVKLDPAVAPAGYGGDRDWFPVDGKIAEKGIVVMAREEFDTGRIKRRIGVEEGIERSFPNALGRK